MDRNAALFLLGTGILSLSLVAAFALACWREGFRSTPKRKCSADQPMPISDAHYLNLRAEMAELSSTLEKLTTTVTRLSSRQGMRDTRAKGISGGPPPPGSSKAELRKFYGLTQNGPDFAARQLDIEEQIERDKQRSN